MQQPPAAAKDFDYHRYLATREWAVRKEAVKARSKGICERCLLAPQTQTHHLTYERVGNEPLEDLMGICRPCHQYLSAKSDFDPCSQRTILCAFEIDTPEGIEFFHPVFIGGQLVPGPHVADATCPFCEAWAREGD